MSSEGASHQNPIETLEEKEERRFVLGLDNSGEVITPLVVANEKRFSLPLKLNHATLAQLGLGEVPGRKGGFCMRIGQKMVMIVDQFPPTTCQVPVL